MPPLSLPWIAFGAVVVLAVLAGLFWWQSNREPEEAGGRQRRHDAVDTVTGWPPQATRILSNAEREAHRLLSAALPDHLVLAQVPLARFLAVPRRHSYSEWVRRVGHLSADLLVCDKASQVIAVVAVQSLRETARGLKRQERMARVLKAAGVRLSVWVEGAWPSADAIRALVQPRPSFGATRTRPGELSEPPAGAAGDENMAGAMREPPPSTWFDDLEASRTGGVQPADPKPPRMPN